MLNIVFFCIVLIFLGIIFSKIKISIENFELNINKLDFNIKIGIFLFGFIKVFGIKCDKNGIKILGKRFSYEKIFKLNLEELILKNLKKKDVEIAEKLNIEVDIARFTLKIGAEDMFITAFLVTFLSGVIAVLLKKNVKKINSKKICYEVLPEFNKIELLYKGKIDISIKTLNIKNAIINTKNNKKAKEAV